MGTASLRALPEGRTARFCDALQHGVYAKVHGRPDPAQHEDGKQRIKEQADEIKGLTMESRQVSRWDRLIKSTVKCRLARGVQGKGDGKPGRALRKYDAMD